MKALVTGGAGFIGRRLVRRLVRDGVEVAVLDALVPSVHGKGAGPPDLGAARFVRGDVRDRAAWKEAAAGGVDAVVHLAAETGTGESMYRTCHYVDANAGGAAVLCDLITRGEVAPKRVALASSRAVYGEGPYRTHDGDIVYPGPRSRADLEAGRWEPTGPSGQHLVPLAASASARTAPASAYGVTKLAQEELLRVALPPAGVDLVALRLQNVYGPGQSLLNPYTGILSIFSVQLLEGAPVRLFEDGLATRDFVYVDDAVDAFARALRTELPSGFAVLDVGGGARTTIAEAAETLRRKLGAPPTAVAVTGEFRVGDIRHATADLRRAEAVLGWRPSTPLDQGLAALAAWVRNAAAPGSRLADALDEMARAGLLGQARAGRKPHPRAGHEAPPRGGQEPPQPTGRSG